MKAVFSVEKHCIKKKSQYVVHYVTGIILYFSGLCLKDKCKLLSNWLPTSKMLRHLALVTFVGKMFSISDYLGL